MNPKRHLPAFSSHARYAIVFFAALAGCGPVMAQVEPGEWLPGGEATNTLLLGSNAFLRPADPLTH